MAITKLALDRYVHLASEVKHLPQRFFRMSYDAEADVVYINFSDPPKPADDSEVTDDDVIIRYDEREEIIGITILHASKR